MCLLIEVRQPYEVLQAWCAFRQDISYSGTLRGTHYIGPTGLKLICSVAPIRCSSLSKIRSNLTPEQFLGGLALSDFMASTEVRDSINNTSIKKTLHTIMHALAWPNLTHIFWSMYDPCQVNSTQWIFFDQISENQRVTWVCLHQKNYEAGLHAWLVA